MTKVIAIDRTTIRRNITLTGKPEPQHIDALVRNGFQYDERAQQWWKMEHASNAPEAGDLFAKLDVQEAMFRDQFNFPVISTEDHQRRFQSYYTPEELAQELVSLAGVKPGMTCLEPSAGDGELARAMLEAGGDVECVEVNPEEAKDLNAFVPTRCMDFLQLQPGTGYDRIVMNPPFSRDQDVRHVCHAFTFLKPGGKLVAIVGSYALNGKTDDRLRFADLLRAYGRVVRELAPGTFENNARSVIVEVTKPSVALSLAA